MSILHGLTYDEYVALDGWRWSEVKILHDGSPHALKWARENPNNGNTPARDKLRAIHALVFEPENFGRDYSTTSARRGTDAYKAHAARCVGTTVLKQSEYDSAQATAHAVRNHPAVKPLLRRGAPEVCVTWKDGPTGLLCKGRIDWLGPLGMLDLKTIGTVHERRVNAMMAKGLYHCQLAHYMAGLHANGIPETLPAYIISAQGKDAQEVAVFRQGAHSPHGPLYVGMELRAVLMEQLAECVESDRWPMRHEEIQEGALPMYALPREDMEHEDNFEDDGDIP